MRKKEDDEMKEGDSKKRKKRVKLEVHLVTGEILVFYGDKWKWRLGDNGIWTVVTSNVDDEVIFIPCTSVVYYTTKVVDDEDKKDNKEGNGTAGLSSSSFVPVHHKIVK